MRPEKTTCLCVCLWPLAEIYGTSVDYLLGRTDVSRPYPRKK